MFQSPISIVFCGTSAFAVPTLQALLSDKRFRIDLVVTQPDKPVGRKQVLTPSAVKVAAQAAEVTVFQPASFNREFASASLPARPGFLVVLSYGQILSQEILDWPTVAPVNVHASLLPRHRGASPIQHTILSGDTEAGVSVQRMVKALDAGAVYASRAATVDPRETTQTLHDSLAALAAPLLIETLTALPEPTAQDESRVTLCGKLDRDDGRVDPSTMTAAQIDTKVRALVPWPGVTWNELKLLETSLEAGPGAMPMPCADGTVLHLVRVQPSGGKPMNGADFARGRVQS